jgi:hypothetical protein
MSTRSKFMAFLLAGLASVSLMGCINHDEVVVRPNSSLVIVKIGLFGRTATVAALDESTNTLVIVGKIRFADYGGYTLGAVDWSDITGNPDDKPASMRVDAKDEKDEE